MYMLKAVISEDQHKRLHSMEELDITKIFYLNKPTRIRSREWGGGGGAINVQSCYKQGIPMDYF